jgi:DNA-binding NarL/FixJ family response regulator
VIGAYVAVVFVVARVVGQAVERSPTAITIATLVAAAAARPVYAAVRDAVDQRFQKRRYEALRMVRALMRVAGGGTVLDPDVVGALLGRHQGQDRLARLSAREREVLGLVAEGRSNAAIARQLVLTEKTHRDSHRKHHDEA